jgi:hypothetical protein
MTQGIVCSRSPSEQHAPGAAGRAERHNRRTILARLATGAAVAGIPSTALAAEPADPHPAWYAEWEALIEWCDGPGPGARDLKDYPEWHRSLEVEDLIARTPARTLDGALCQLRMARYYTSATYTGEAADAAVENAIASLAQLAGEASHV